MGGALKNIYAIAGGACAGLKLGQNSLAGLITRCLAEMTRIGVQAGARPETFAGLSGMGDLLLTATSEQSRNFRCGLALAQGMPLDKVLAATRRRLRRRPHHARRAPRQVNPRGQQADRDATAWDSLRRRAAKREAVKNLLSRAPREE